MDENGTTTHHRCQQQQQQQQSTIRYRACEAAKNGSKGKWYITQAYISEKRNDLQMTIRPSLSINIKYLFISELKGPLTVKRIHINALFSTRKHILGHEAVGSKGLNQLKYSC